MPMTPGQAAAALAGLPIAETLAGGLAQQSARLAEAVRASLANPPGSQHDEPWRQTGALQTSIGDSSEGLNAQVGSNESGSGPAGVRDGNGAAAAVPRAGCGGAGRADRPRYRPGPSRSDRAPIGVGPP